MLDLLKVLAVLALMILKIMGDSLLWSASKLFYLLKMALV